LEGTAAVGKNYELPPGESDVRRMHMIGQPQDLLTDAITWKKTVDREYPFTGEVNGDKFVIRLNDFPSDSLYTLLVNGEEVIDFDDWPEQWESIP
jgi:hypothetical protein